MLFEQARREILHAIGPWIVAVEHIGSTAVPGLAVKPIVNIIAGLRRLEDAPQYIAALQPLSWRYAPENEASFPERRYFDRDLAGVRAEHLHMVETASEFWERHLLFSDFLRAHRDVAQEYAQLKRELANKFRDQRDTYTDAKGPFIRQVEAKARAERRYS
ncbi:MAG: GrpB family protein [Dehalococcoidia bacterium]|nr:GrpB family protein [Dehalococcoidia bacterium]